MQPARCARSASIEQVWPLYVAARKGVRAARVVGAAGRNGVQPGHGTIALVQALAVLLTLLDGFLTRPAERLAVLGEDGQGSEAFKRLVGKSE